MKKPSKKLTLDLETIRLLRAGDLHPLVGGAPARRTGTEAATFCTFTEIAGGCTVTSFWC